MQCINLFSLSGVKPCDVDAWSGKTTDARVCMTILENLLCTSV